jgi:FKBP-type peptidyl-prolyl cis-trans isomerase FkpA
MRLTFFTLLLLSIVGFVSCRKSGDNIDIKQYDAQQIQAYIAANGITGMQQDTTGHDSTGTYYKIIDQGTGPALGYADSISYVYTIKSFDGKFSVQDTVLNHVAVPLGHVVPNGLQLGIHNLLKYRGGKMRILVPSHLAYGERGVGTGSVTLTNVRIAGNQCLDYTIYIVPNQKAYDDLVIKNYMTANSLTGYTKTADGLYYKITTPGTGANVNNNSIVTVNYVGKLMNNEVFNDFSTTTASFGDLLNGYSTGFVEGLKLINSGGAISLIIPSHLAYGSAGNSGSTPAIPANACLRFDVSNVAITNF